MYYSSNIVAQHEAGHVLQSLLLGTPFDHVSIIPDETTMGRLKNGAGIDRLSTRQWISILTAGMVAEGILHYKCRPFFIMDHTRNSGDYEAAMKAATAIHYDDQRCREMIIDIANEVYGRLSDSYLSTALDKIAGIIQDHRELTFEQLSNELHYSYFRPLITNCKKR